MDEGLSALIAGEGSNVLVTANVCVQVLLSVEAALTQLTLVGAVPDTHVYPLVGFKVTLDGEASVADVTLEGLVAGVSAEMENERRLLEHLVALGTRGVVFRLAVGRPVVGVVLVSNVLGEAGLVHKTLAAVLTLLGPALVCLPVPGQLLGGGKHLVAGGAHVVPPHLGFTLVLGVGLEAVFVEAHYILISLVAHITVHFLPIHMGDQMSLQCLPGGECTLTGGAAVRTLSRVSAHVHLQLRFALEPAAAFLALEEHKTHVEELML